MLEAKLLKTKGFLKTAARFTPLMVILAGLGVFTGLMTGGTFKRVDAIEQFKQTHTSVRQRTLSIGQKGHQQNGKRSLTILHLIEG